MLQSSSSRLTLRHDSERPHIFSWSVCWFSSPRCCYRIETVPLVQNSSINIQHFVAAPCLVGNATFAVEISFFFLYLCRQNFVTLPPPQDKLAHCAHTHCLASTSGLQRSWTSGLQLIQLSEPHAMPSKCDGLWRHTCLCAPEDTFHV